MATMNMKNGLSRLCMLLAVVWLVGMGVYQYQDAQSVKDNSMTISLNKDTELRIDASGIKQNDKSEIEVKRFALIVLPALLLLLVVPVGGWVARGFKPETK